MQSVHFCPYGLAAIVMEVRSPANPAFAYLSGIGDTTGLGLSQGQAGFMSNRQAHTVLGSASNFADDTARSVSKLDPAVDPGTPGILPLLTIDGKAEELDLDNIANAGAVCFGVAGWGNVTSNSFNDSISGDDFAIGAPSSGEYGVAKAFVATGHPWVVPGESILLRTCGPTTALSSAAVDAWAMSGTSMATAKTTSGTWHPTTISWIVPKQWYAAR